MSQGHVLKGSEIPVGSVLCECGGGAVESMQTATLQC